MEHSVSRTAEIVYEQLTGEDDGRVCRDIPESACDAQPENFLRHVLSLGATKTGDGLADAKLVLSWLLGALGAPAWMIGFLVPIREAGALLPQLVTAASIRALPLRKRAWALGSLVQGICVIAMGVAALSLDGAVAGGVVLALLVVMSLARSVCSVSYKDVLGKTVSKATRGTATGTASTLAAALVFTFGAALAFGLLPLSIRSIALVLCVAGLLWILAALLFSTLQEQPGASEGGVNGLAVVIDQFAMLGRDPQLRLFILVRGLLIATALAPPFLLTLGGRSGADGLGELGMYLVASSLAAVASTYLWGRLADVSSRRVLIGSGLVASLPLAAACAIGALRPDWLQQPLLLPALLFLLMIAYQGVRLGRATHVVDMADGDTRAAYTALSNTLIGLLLLAGGAFGFVAGHYGEAVLLGVFAAMSVLASLCALRLAEVQSE